ncbi:hypothetical protein [Nocardia australiensis]|uniref:hypothetical protein n=1 Tax=Nocardia australiensis TaxID=2887191 RepID=UPI001D13A638|nr:hypothetical protein [Nocardia australiensis]
MTDWPASSCALSGLAREYGDGSRHLIVRATVQRRTVRPEAAAQTAEIAELGLLPSATPERIRNIMVSPLIGRIGGRADLAPYRSLLDALFCADPALVALPARFVFVLDDRSDLDASLADDIIAQSAAEVMVTPWRGLPLPDLEVHRCLTRRSSQG